MDKNKLKLLVVALIVVCVAIFAYTAGTFSSAPPAVDPNSPSEVQRQAGIDAEAAADAAAQAAASARKAADSTKKTSESAEVSAKVTAEAAKASAALTRE